MNRYWRGSFVFLCVFSLLLEGCSWFKSTKNETHLTHSPSASVELVKEGGDAKDEESVDFPEPEKAPRGALKKAPIQNDRALEQDLLRAAQSIERSLTTLASAQEAKSPPVIRTAALVTPEGGMGGKIDVDWVGPLFPLLNRIAELTHYRIKVLGREPALPIIVTVCQKGAIIADVLQNASFQAGVRAKILVFPENKVIELRYL